MPKDSIPWEEFLKRMEGFDEEVYRILDERIRTNYKRAGYEFLTDEEAELLNAMLDRLIPQEGIDPKIDLVSFLDWAIPKPLGYGHRYEGMPDERAIFRQGMKGVDETSRAMFEGRAFRELTDDQKDEVLRAVQEGRAEGDAWKGIPSTLFFTNLMNKALCGYCAHPRVWVRIGFYGPAYPEGYVWVSRLEVKGRHEKKPGYLSF